MSAAPSPARTPIILVVTAMVLALSGCATYHRNSQPDIVWQGKDRRQVTLSRTNETECRTSLLFSKSNCDTISEITIERDSKNLFAFDDEYEWEMEGVYRIRDVCFCNDQPVIKVVHVVGLYDEREPIGVFEFSPERPRPAHCSTSPLSWVCQGWHTMPAKNLSQRRTIDRRLSRCDCHAVARKERTGPWSADHAADMRWKHGVPRSRIALRGVDAPVDRRDWTPHESNQAQPQYCYEVALFANPELQGKPLIVEWNHATKQIQGVGTAKGAKEMADCLTWYRWKPAESLNLHEIRLSRRADLRVALELSHGDLPGN